MIINSKYSFFVILYGSIIFSPFLSTKAETAPVLTWARLLGTSGSDSGWGVAASDGSVYFGQLKNGAPHGQGRMTLPNGVLYVGQFKNSKFNGAGTLYKIDGSKVIGFFLDGFSHGYTKTILPNGKIEEDYYIDYGIANLVKESNWEQKRF